MGNLFGKKNPPKPKVTDTDRQILELKQIRDKLQQYIKRLESQMERDRATAKNAVAQKKLELAKLLLRKKKFLEQLHTNAHGELENIEKMIETVDLTQLQKEVVQGLKEGNALLQQMQSTMKIEDVERVMDETREAMEFQREVANILAGNLSASEEADVEQEYEKLLADQLISQIPEVPEKAPEVSLNLPEVPTHVPARQPSPVKTEDRVMLVAS